MIRFGLCCKFEKEPIHFKTTTVTYLKRLKDKKADPNSYISELILHNANSLLASIEYCHTHLIGSFRVNSYFFPCITHPDVMYTLEDLADQKEILSLLALSKAKAQEYSIRLTFHPSQFILLSSPSDEVTQKSVEDLCYHADVSQLIGADVINIHMGGKYKDADAAIGRVIANFKLLPEKVQSRLTIENDDKTYSPAEVIPVCKELGIPFVYDVHHHRCYKDQLSEEEATEGALSTWKNEPLFHLSSPLNGWNGKNPEHHHDYINPNDFPLMWKNIPNLTVDIEAKAKELAIAKLQKELCFTGF